MFIKQLAVGLRLVEVQHIPIHSIKDLTAATKTIVATQKKAGSVGSTNVVFRFQEPAYIVSGALLRLSRRHAPRSHG